MLNFINCTPHKIDILKDGTIVSFLSDLEY